MKVIYILCVICAIVICSCNKNQEKPVYFYHWKTNYTHNLETDAILKKANSDKMYVRFFDLSLNSFDNSVLPTATLQIKQNDTLSVAEIIPVIYITNEVFEKTTTASDLQKLAKNSADKLYRIATNSVPKHILINEIQIDCDWTVGTRDAYFKFLKFLKKEKSFLSLSTSKKTTKISATVRLHQVKFREKTGVPPVNEVTIMIYNVGNLGNISETNSIINNRKTAQYLGRLKEYPLPFNVALPIFSWGVLYRNNELNGLLSDITTEQLSENFRVTDTLNIYKAKADTYMNKTFVYKGDLLRMESVIMQDLKELKKMISDNAATEYSVILYHLNSYQLKQLDIDELLKIVR